MQTRKKYSLLLITLIVVIASGGLGVYWYNQEQIQARLEYIHERGTLVMPFDLNKTTHFFDKTETGGIQKIQTKDPQDKEQITLIRTHLQKEKELFDSGDFSDPSALHGESMPGLTVLEKSADKLEVEYSDLPDGAQLIFLTDDAKVIDALHMWFMAQLQDHGSDAMGHM